MRMTMKQGALALALLSGAGAVCGPRRCDSIHDEGDFGGGYTIVGPGGPEHHDYLRHHVFRPNDETRPFYGCVSGQVRRGAMTTYGPAVAFTGPTTNV